MSDFDLSPRYYDRDGRPLAGVEEWGVLFEQPDYKRVLETTLPDGKWVSTVWLGLDHGFRDLGDPHPLIFETMVFEHAEWRLGRELDCQRYHTEEEALAGHTRMVRAWSGEGTGVAWEETNRLEDAH